ncbi:hypothetical protein D3C76_1854570 [compost metagenome]
MTVVAMTSSRVSGGTGGASQIPCSSSRGMQTMALTSSRFPSNLFNIVSSLMMSVMAKF